MINIILICAAYFLGFFISFLMMRIEVAAEKQVYTKGDRILNMILSLLSWIWVLIILIITWVNNLKRLGYWSQPVKEPVKTPAA